MEFRVLGPVQAIVDGHPVALGGPKQRALLAELLLHGGAVLTRDHLVDAIWGDDPPDKAASSLQVYVHGLRRALGTERIETHGNGYCVRLEHGELDAERFERLVDDAARALAEGRPGEAEEDLGRALALWGGPPLADVADQPVAQAAGPRLEEIHLRALELRNDARLALGAHDAALPDLEAHVAEHPYRERFREQHVLALYRAGRQKEALDAYRDARHMLVEELGVDPGPALQELERAILRQDEDLAGPVPLVRRTALPTPATSLVGRRLEIAAVEAMLRRDDVRLVTLTGPGGTGKTRLALAVAQAIAPELRDGAVFVDLASVTDPDLVLPTVAQALELAAADDVLQSIKERSLLLVLDNLEQLGAATRPVAELLAAGPRVRALATSRTPLKLSGEHEYPVPPLPTPGATHSFEALVGNDAVRLFTTRAQAVSPGFVLTEENVESVAAICRRLDGLPLAIELAAARTRAFPLSAIEQRLGQTLELLVEGARDLPLRQQTLRATLDWSYGLLAEPERALLARLAVFAGMWRLEDAETVLGEDIALPLATLVDNSLLRRRGERFGLLETIRAYAVEKLAGEGELGEYTRRHARHFFDVAEAARVGILEGGEREEQGLAVLDEEQENLHAALAWAIESADVDAELGFAAAHRWYWLVRGRLNEAARVFEHAIEVSAARPALHASALVGAGTFNVRRGERRRGAAQLEAALSLFRELGDESEVSRCIAELGHVAVDDGDLDRAFELYTEASEVFERVGNFTRQAVALSNLAAIAARRGDSETAAAQGERAIALQRAHNDLDGTAVSLANLGRVRLALGEEEAARAALRESLTLALRLDYRMLLAYLLGGAGELALRSGNSEQAARLIGGSGGAFEAIAMQIPQEEVDEHEQTLAAVREALGDERTAELVEAGRRAPFDELIEEVRELTR